MSMTLPERLAAFGSALGRLRAALDRPLDEWTRDAAIQRFGFTFELAWKCVQQAAVEEGLECASPRAALRVAARLGWIADDEVWLRMLDDRNRSSHTYDEAAALAVHASLAGYSDALSGLLAKLRQR
jgi:nucleotidyltransferase substrate binding protein (TIGR01987 family)